MRSGGLGFFKFMLGTIPIIDLPTTGGRLVLGERGGLLADLKLAGRSIEILDFGAEKGPMPAARVPLRNHSLDPERIRLAPEGGRGMLLGREPGAPRPPGNSGGPHQENAGGLY